MNDILLRAASLVAIVSTLYVLWKSSRSRSLSMLAYATGIAGGLIVLAGGLDARVPKSLIGVGFLLAAAGTYVWLFRRERARGGSVLDALTVEYQPRLSWFERSFFVLMSIALVALAWLTPDFGLLYRVGMSAFAPFGLFIGISGRPPHRSVRTATPNDR